MTNGNAIDLTIFVPCYNEETRIIGTLETIRVAMAELPGLSWEAIVVDDGSKDKTISVVESYLERNPSLPINLHKNPKNLGLARSFVDTAFMGRGTYYRLVCGDNVEPKETMIHLLRQIGKADMILPYYPVLPGKSGLRKCISKLWTFLVDKISGYDIHYYNGCAIYKRYHVMRWAPYNYGFGFQADLITILLDEGATYLETPVQGFHVEKGSGQSPVNLRNLLSTGHTLFIILLRRIKRMIS